MKNLSAITIPLGPPGGYKGFGNLGNPGSLGGATTLFNTTLSSVIGVLTVVAFIWFTFQVILGAIGIVSSGGDKAALERARKQITTGIIGVIVVVSAIFIVDLIGTLLGVGSILNPTCIIYNNC